MEIERTGIRPRADRHAFRRKVDVNAGGGAFRIEAKSEDISLSGMALSFTAPVMDNGAFVELHAEGLGTITGTVARTYDGGAAVRFSELLDSLPDGAGGAPGGKHIDRSA